MRFHSRRDDVHTCFSNHLRGSQQFYILSSKLYLYIRNYNSTFDFNRFLVLIRKSKQFKCQCLIYSGFPTTGGNTTRSRLKNTLMYTLRMYLFIVTCWWRSHASPGYISFNQDDAAGQQQRFSEQMIINFRRTRVIFPGIFPGILVRTVTYKQVAILRNDSETTSALFNWKYAR